MGCISSRSDEKIELKPVDTPKFTLSPDLVLKEKAAYGMSERQGFKSFLGKDGFTICQSTVPGTYTEKLKVTQSMWDMGQDRMLLVDIKSNSVICVVRRARMSWGNCFYIYTQQPPYEGAQKNDWNEKLDDEVLYCYGFLQKKFMGGYEISKYYADPEHGASPNGKDPYKKAYFVEYPTCMTANLIFKPVDDKGEASKDADGNDVICACISRDFWQWDHANSYAVEVAPGADAALFVMSCAMIDEIIEDAQDNSNN